MVVVSGRLEPEVGRAAHAGARRSPRDPVPAGPRAGRATPSTGAFPRKRPRWPSSRPMPWPCSRSRPSTTSIPAPRASATRWWSTSMPTVLADPDQPGQSVLEDGARVSAETSRRLACDASRVVMRHDDDGRLLEIGARTRTIPPALRRALHHRDRGCRFPGCGVRFGQGHHLRHWAHGGPDHALEPRAALSPASPGRARGGLPGRARARRGAPIPAAGRPAAARGAAACCGAA